MGPRLEGRGGGNINRRGCKTGTHSKLLLIEVPNVVRQVGLETSRRIGSCGVSPSAVFDIKRRLAVSVQPNLG